MGPVSNRSGGRRREEADDLAWRYGWITPREAMAHLGLGSRSALQRLIEQHRLPYGRMGRNYRFRRADLDAWMKGGQGTTT
jgi:excisionase family DNA binding protein